MPEDEGGGYPADAVERRVLDFWKQHGTFARSIELRAKATPFVWLEGPPTANGLPHAGHVLTRTLKDVVGRYKTMRGYRVERKAGWDCHGLPVEIEVEKELGLKSKSEIEAFGVAKFNQRCRDSVFRYKKEWEEMCQRLGQWIDYDRPYVTLSNDYIESVWWSLKEAYGKGLLYRGFRVAAYCPRCGTGLSSHEVGLGYKTVEEASVFVKFPVKGRKNEFILAWTTTPWTLPGNIALAVGTEITYVTVEQKTPKGTERYILAKDRLDALKGEHTIVKEQPGSELAGLAYEPLFTFMRSVLFDYAQQPPDIKAEIEGVNVGWALGTKPAGKERKDLLWTVVAADFVTTQEGTGVVHTAVMYGEDDYDLGMSLGLPAIHTVNSEGKFRKFVTGFAGKFVKEADPLIIEDLRSRNLLLRVKNHEHDYPFCWRCTTPLLYYARNQWFIRMSQLRERLVAHNDTVQWMPSHIRAGRFGDFIRNVRDWALSRDRYWGTPLPIWNCGSCGHVECVGSLEELSRLGGEPVRKLMASGRLDLHKPAVDDVRLTCPKCKGTMTRDASVIDTWYDSGAAHFAQWHYPFENKEKVQTVDFVTEGIDQTRGWFYTLLATSTVLFDRPAYRTSVVMGLVLDEKGLKMSKKLKNYTDPNELFVKYGADAVRWYLLTSSAVTADKRFSARAVEETYARFFLTLWNTYRFLEQYAALDGWKPGQKAPPVAKRPALDRWLVARASTVAVIARREGDSYNFHKTTLAIQDFLVDDLSNWWLRRSRRRFWTEGDSPDKASAYATLHEALVTVVRLAAPFAPFISEHLFRSLRLPKDAESVHLTDYPEGREPSDAIETAMVRVREIAEASRSLRDRAQIKTRIPLPRLTVAGLARDPLLEDLGDVLKDEVNVKAIEWTTMAKGLEEPEATLNQMEVGRQFKGEAKRLLEAARASDPKVHGRELSKRGKVLLAGTELEARFFNVKTVAAEGILRADLLGGGTVLLDAHLTPDLEAEGWAREVVRRIQEMRKEARLKLEDEIHTQIRASEAVVGPVRAWLATIQKETRSRSVDLDGRTPAKALVKDWDIEGERVTIAIAKAGP